MAFSKCKQTAYISCRRQNKFYAGNEKFIHIHVLFEFLKISLNGFNFLISQEVNDMKLITF